MLMSAAPLAPSKLADDDRPAASPSGGGRLILFLVGVLVLWARLWRVSSMTFPDHDSGRNWLIANAIMRGDFHDLFVHASPTFYLLLAPIAHWLGPENFRWLLVLNALLNTLALVWLARTVARWAGVPWPEQALLTLLLGLSTYYTFAGRELAITSPTLLLAAWILHLYWRRVTASTIGKRRRRLLSTVAVLAFGLTINYKLVLLGPIGLALEWSRRRDGTLSWGILTASLAILVAPFAIYVVVAVAIGLPWYRLPAAWILIIFWRTASWRAPTGGGDWLFYGRYLLRFESPLALVGLIAGPWLLARRASWPPRALLGILLGLGLGGIALMSLLTDKAPRGLAFVLAPLLVLGALGIWQAFGPTRRVMTRLVLGTAVLAQASVLWREVWVWNPPSLGLTPHAKVATWLREHGVRRLATTSALGIVPYAAANGVDVFDAPTPDSLRALVRNNGCRYVLLDGYRLAAGLDSLGADLNGEPVLQLTYPALLSPLLFLEHADFVHESFNHALDRQHRAWQQPWQLVLLDTQPQRKR
jgi:hypothetical protein